MQDKNSRKTILIVDDVPDNIDLLAGILNRDYKVKAALNGHKAIKIAESFPHPDLILLDIMMPGIDGYEVCRRLKANATTKTIPVLFVTALDEVEDEAKGLALGAVDYIIKPISPAIVLARVKTHIDLKMHRDAIESALKLSDAKLSEISKQTEQLSLAASSMILIRDEREFFSKISRAIVEFSDYRRVVISLFKDQPPYRDIIAFGGVEEEVVDSLRSVEMHKAWYDKIFVEENNIGQFSYYIPHTKKHLLDPAAVYGTGPVPESENSWHPEDNLFVRMNDENGKTIGVISVDESKSGFKPGPETVRPLEIFSSLISQIVILKKEQNERKKIEAELRQTQKMEAIGTLAGGIAHDFNNILSGILGYAELIEEDLEDCRPIARERMKRVIMASLRGRDLVNQILDFSQSRQSEPVLIQVKLIINEVLKLLKASLPSSIKIEPFLESESYVMADPIGIHQIIMNLCSNAKDAMNNNGGILSLRLEDKSVNEKEAAKHDGIHAGLFLVVSVQDTGNGMTKEVMDRVLEPFFTTKPQGKGTGMGLSVVHGIVKSLNGFMTINSEPQKGSTFRIYIPVSENPSASDYHAVTELKDCEGKEKILFVDDEMMLTEMVNDTLKRFGYDVTFFSDSLKALKAFKEDPEQFDLVISDTTMPGMTGDILVEQIRRIRPEIPVILCTGFSERMNETRAGKLHINALLYKPIPAEKLILTIREIMDGEGHG